MQGKTFIFFGRDGSGKGTQAKLLAEYLDKKTGQKCVATSTGDEYRKLLQSGSYTGSLVKESITRGELQPNFLTNTLFMNILLQNLSSEKHLIADGYPRTVNQSENFEQAMKYYDRSEVVIINIELSKEEGHKRNALRGRHDDTPESFARRAQEYENNVVPAMNYLKDKTGYNFLSINGDQSIEDVHKDIIKALNL